jgi:hypothetical protein
MELLLIGWALQLAMGVAFWVLPRFTREPRYGKIRLGWLAFGLLNAGIMIVAIGYWFGTTATYLFVGRLAEGLATLLFVVAVWPRVKAIGHST